MRISKIFFSVCLLAKEIMSSPNSRASYKLKIEDQRMCDEEFIYTCSDGENEEVCGEWVCTDGALEFSTCTVVFDKNQEKSFENVERTCKCHIDVGPFKVFTGCKWIRSLNTEEKPEKESRKSTTSVSTTSSTKTTTTTSTPQITTTIATTFSSSTEKSQSTQERNENSVQSNHQGQPMLLDVVNSEDSNWKEMQKKNFIEEQAEEIEERRSYPIKREKNSRIGKLKTAETTIPRRIIQKDGTYVHAFEFMQHLQQMMFMNGLFQRVLKD
ncbi:Oidioi.mRNA.OKI2018_I69.chr1.g507.t1.cds [Oikopleura dioica]|uniref:Oidioi.mRNA.OKI2018_I69.chr1.g507.t1.cds n=1 Tax=Oikopleura dioica TaxID=34765 RepID=A0ABN7SK23_OIKDI|nr:Oidioi.mRNA.OKI2018_I69.chr1.g507.t1.cds [Oikopleura dioica]